MSISVSVAADRSAVISRISQGIKSNKISDADLLSIAAESAAKKRQQRAPLSQVDFKTIQKSFEQEMFNASIKENMVPRPNTVSPSYRSLTSSAKSFSCNKSPDHNEDNNIDSGRRLPFLSRLRFGDESESEDEESEEEEERFDIGAWVHEEVLAIGHSVDTEMDREEAERRSRSSSAHEDFATDDYNDVVEESSENAEEEDDPEPPSTPSSAALRGMVREFLVNLLNSGSYEELVILQGIGKVRALKIIEQREEGFQFETIEDLEAIGMNHKLITKFLRQNLGCIMHY